MTGFAEKYGPWGVVTGAGAGVGLAYTEELISRGVGVVMVDISPGVVETAAGLGGRTRTVITDVSDPGWIDVLTEQTAGLEIGIAVANAGVSYVRPFLDMDAEMRRKTLDVNCRATVDLASWALPAMAERGRGGFVVTSSGSALAGTACVGLYSATKAFSINLIEAIGWELKDSGVDTLAIVAPSMDTPALRSSNPDHERMGGPPVDPRTVVAPALDALGEGGRWLGDDGLKFAATVERSDRVDMMCSATAAMYHLFED
ncbi:MAG: SDR family NAD(P)-dependent oxidoreductase [Acidimicrobiaceae bacterium]|nr:SDR family NAD(P)-dependent oxidoreductase [Acidimicrobiaceae bacterium]MDE0607925.1 SDR family NAD(P)-dependent oxidoreductase [Acidimicrobiaceae bacterium]